MSMRERALWKPSLYERFKQTFKAGGYRPEAPRPVKVIRKAGGYKPQVRRRRVRINHVSKFILSRPRRKRRGRR